MKYTVTLFLAAFAFSAIDARSLGVEVSGRHDLTPEVFACGFSEFNRLEDLHPEFAPWFARAHEWWGGVQAAAAECNEDDDCLEALQAEKQPEWNALVAELASQEGAEAVAADALAIQEFCTGSPAPESRRHLARYDPEDHDLHDGLWPCVWGQLDEIRTNNPDNEEWFNNFYTWFEGFQAEAVVCAGDDDCLYELQARGQKEWDAFIDQLSGDVHDQVLGIQEFCTGKPAPAPAPEGRHRLGPEVFECGWNEFNRLHEKYPEFEQWHLAAQKWFNSFHGEALECDKDDDCLNALQEARQHEWDDLQDQLEALEGSEEIIQEVRAVQPKCQRWDETQ